MKKKKTKEEMIEGLVSLVQHLDHDALVEACEHNDRLRYSKMKKSQVEELYKRFLPLEEL